MSEQERSEFIAAMRGVAHSVTVVSTSGPAGKHGATVSAFSSVSADPPKILICLNSASKISELVCENKTFTVTVLPNGFENVADRFAGRHDSWIKNRFEGMERADAQLDLPGATVFECMLDSAIQSGTHQIVIGNVTLSKAGSEDPLIYLSGAYRQVLQLPQAAE